jgi:hypothetical protein
MTRWFCAVSQALVDGFLQRSPGFCFTGVHDGFVVDGVALDRFWMEHCLFSTIRGWCSVHCSRKTEKEERKMLNIICVCARKNL